MLKVNVFNFQCLMPLSALALSQEIRQGISSPVTNLGRIKIVHMLCGGASVSRSRRGNFLVVFSSRFLRESP